MHRQSSVDFWDNAGQPLLAGQPILRIPRLLSDTSVASTPRSSSPKHSIAKCDFDVERTPTQDTATRIHDMDMRVDLIKRNAEDRPFILVLNTSQSWVVTAQFISKSRAAYIPKRTPIIVLHSESPPDHVLKEVNLSGDPDVAVVKGAINRVQDLLKSGLRECCCIVCAGAVSEEENSELSEMLDADVTMLHQLLQRIGIKGKKMIFQFHRLQNLGFLSQKDHCLDNGIAADVEEDYTCNPHFASGRILTSRPLASMLAHAFYTPGIMELMSTLAAPDDIEEGTFPWQVRLSAHSTVLTYGDLFCKCVQDLHHYALPIGILRRFDDYLGTDSCEGYVWTNPGPSIELKDDDLVYMLGSKAFGSWAHDAGFLVHPGDPSADFVCI